MDESDENEDEDFFLIHATNSMKLNATIYDPLPVTDGKNYIRLVELKEGLDNQEHVQVVLHIHNIEDDQCPPFRALSYEWIASTDIRDIAPISCDGKISNVSKSLDAALRNRLSYHLGRNLYWIDEISINQDDIEERNRQAQFAHRIFGKALETIVWLGDGNACTNHAFKAIERALWSATRESGLTGLSQQALQDQTDVSRETPRTSPEEWSDFEVDYDSLACIELLLRKPWFSRFWSVQEVAVSKSIVLTCGHRRIDMDAFFAAMSLIKSTAIRNNSFGLSSRLDSIFLANMRYRDRQDPVFYLENLLRLTQHFETTDPRDRIFAFSRLTSCGAGLLSRIIDYNVNIRQLFTATTYETIQQYGHLDLLEAAGFKNNTAKDLPSWALSVGSGDSSRAVDSLKLDGTFDDLMKDEQWLSAVAIAFYRYQSDVREDFDKKVEDIMALDHTTIDRASEARHDDSKPRASMYAATADSKQIDIDCDLTKGALKVRAQIFDRIEDMRQALPSIDPPAQLTDSLIEDLFKGGILRSIAAPFKHLVTQAWNAASEVYTQFDVWAKWDRFVEEHGEYPTGEAVLDVYRKTITGGSQTLSRTNMEKSYHIWQNFRTHNEQNKSEGRPSRVSALAYGCAVFLNMGLASAFLPFPAEAAQFGALIAPAVGRRLVWTKKGYLALLPPSAWYADVIALLPGARLPFVLRPCNDQTYQVIGPCYVHGIMHGEAYDENACQTITLV